LENTSVREALATQVPTVGITDTNSDPSLVDYPIPANDDAVGSLQLIISYILDSWKEGRNSAGKPEAPKSPEKAKPEVKAAAPKKESKPKPEKKPAAKKTTKAKK
jgi:small subunit ribosomal protein S2